MTFYSDMAATALEMITEYGSPVTFTRTAVTVSLTAGTVTAGASTTATGYAIVLPASKGTIEAFDNRLEQLALAKRRLRYLKVAAQGLSFEPQALDKLSLLGSTWEVLGCTPINPTGTPLVYGVGVVEL